MATTVTKTFTERFSWSGDYRVVGICDLVSETYDESTYKWTRVYSLQGRYPRTGQVSMDISIPSTAVITSVAFSLTADVTGDYVSYTNTTMSLPDYGDRAATNANLKAYLNASHPSTIKLNYYFGYTTRTITKTESTSTPSLPTAYQWIAYIHGVTPKMVVTYTVDNEEYTVSFGTNNTWQKCKVYYAVNGVWQKVKGYFGADGTWKQVK